MYLCLDYGTKDESLENSVIGVLLITLFTDE